MYNYYIDDYKTLHIFYDNFSIADISEVYSEKEAKSLVQEIIEGVLNG
jgi:hypothetical protein